MQIEKLRLPRKVVSAQRKLGRGDLRAKRKCVAWMDAGPLCSWSRSRETGQGCGCGCGWVGGNVRATSHNLGRWISVFLFIQQVFLPSTLLCFHWLPSHAVGSLVSLVADMLPYVFVAGRSLSKTRTLYNRQSRGELVGSKCWSLGSPFLSCNSQGYLLVPPALSCIAGDGLYLQNVLGL